MDKESSKPKVGDRSQSRKTDISLAPLTPDEAMRRLLNVNPADVKKLEAEEKAAKGKTGKPKK